MTDATNSSCPRCKAYWLEGEPSCRFCGFNPASQAGEPSRFDPDAQPSLGPAAENAGVSGGSAGAGRRLSRMATALVALVVAVGLAGGIAYAASRTVLADEHGNHDLSAVCDGEGHSGAAAYDADEGSSGLIVMTRSADGWNSSDSTAVSGIDLVGCRTQGDEPYRSIGCQARWTQSMHDLTPDSGGSGEIVTYSTEFYRITIEFREARTAEIVATEHVSPTISCPADESTLMLDANTKKHKVVPRDEADAVVAAYAGDTAD